MRLKRNMAHFAASLRALALLMLVPTVCQAGGFALNEFSARGNAMGGAVMALPGDASTVIYNPAGMTQLPGSSTMVGFTAIAPTADVRAGSGSETTLQTNIYTPPHAYYVQQLTDKVWFGIGEYTRFGLGTQFGYDWAGTTKTYKAELSSYSIAPNLAIKLTDNLSVAIGPEIIYSSADLRKRPTSTTDMRMKVDGVGFGMQAAMLYTFNDEWSAGFVYHSTQKQSDSGHVHYTENALMRNQALTINMTLPASYSLGVAYKPNKDWKIEADATFTQWQDYEKLEYNFENQADTTSWKNWRNVWRFQLGGEYMAKDWLALRAGFVWDQDPIRKGYEDYMLPTNDRKIYSLGFGILQDKLTYDFSLMYLVNNDRSLDSNANLKGATQITNSKAYMAGISIGYKF
ncbi:MAG: outer membrane protein transport protein [Desulfovibrio sp.]|jgi:long-chain fatty acid transport protein|nr:outer membrane protein transport protein [Desulfovibrio sp.]